LYAVSDHCRPAWPVARISLQVIEESLITPPAVGAIAGRNF
jgi:hypothetical protein